MTTEVTTIRVPSHSAPGTEHTVYLDTDEGDLCTCKGFAYRGRCRHTGEVRQAAREPWFDVVNVDGTGLSIRATTADQAIARRLAALVEANQRDMTRGARKGTPNERGLIAIGALPASAKPASTITARVSELYG